MRARSVLLTLVALTELGACRSSAPSPPPPPAAITLSSVAEDYVKLALQHAAYDPDYVDAYHGPAAWKEQAEAVRIPLEELRARADRLLETANSLEVPADVELQARLRMLRMNIAAMRLRMDIVAGETPSFDEEAKVLFDVTLPKVELATLAPLLGELEALLPGEGPLADRFEALRVALRIPEAKRAAVMQRAIDECRKRTMAFYDLPPQESFTVEFVSDKPWGGYNWYQGGFRSLIQINTDIPPEIDRAVDLGCHEGYPGHHVWNLFVERELVDERGWVEYTLVPLFSPSAFIAEGSANYGIELAFPEDERRAFEESVLYPLAGLDPSLAAPRIAIGKILSRLAPARAQIIRAYLNQEIDRAEAASLLRTYLVLSEVRAEKALAFAEKYRSYVLNYGLGRRWVRRHVERATDRAGRWQRFRAILSLPTSASALDVTD